MRFGIHVSKTSKIDGKTSISMTKALELEMKRFNLNSAQIFTHGPRNASPNKMDCSSVRSLIKDMDASLYVHGSYLSVGLWNVLDKGKKLTLNHVLDIMHSACMIDALGVVIHLSKKPVETIKKCMDLVQQGLEDIKVEYSCNIPMLLLESPAMKPGKWTYESPEKLNNLCDALKENTDWGLCIDTAHLWSGGVDLSKPDSWDKWVGELTDLARSKIKLIHLNGALESTFGTGKDIHIIPFSEEDAIWGKSKKSVNNSSFKSIIDFCIANDIDVISEINRGDKKDSIEYINIVNKITSCG
jgi:endonuclease IV